MSSDPGSSVRGSAHVDSGFAETVTDEFLSTIDHVFEESGVPFVSRSGHGEVLVLSPLQDGVEVDAVRSFLVEALSAVQTRTGGARVAAGVSASCSALDGLPRAVGQARLALRQGAARGGAPVMLFDELGVRYKALDSLPDDVLRELRDGVVGVLTVADATHGGGLLLTLEAYLAGGYSVSETAAALFIHRNTLRKRLARIEALTDLDLASSGGQAEAYLSVHAAEVLAIREG
jgi:purine catabolism regulator